jgi:hypothetical protein
VRAEQRDEGLVVDREWITKMYGLSDRWARRELPVHGYDSAGRALHLITPEVVQRLSTTRPRRHRRDTPRRAEGP